MLENLLFYGGLAGIVVSLWLLAIMFSVFPKRRKKLLDSLENGN